jgi:hypothetical protein
MNDRERGKTKIELRQTRYQMSRNRIAAQSARLVAAFANIGFSGDFRQLFSFEACWYRQGAPARVDHEEPHCIWAIAHTSLDEDPRAFDVPLS